MPKQPEEKSLVERLRSLANGDVFEGYDDDSNTLREAADRIEELERQVEYGVQIKYVGRSKPPVVTDDD